MNSLGDASHPNQIRWKDLTFHPWVGPLYRSSGLDGIRLLIVGESHHGGPEEVCPDFTQQVVQDRAICGRHRFFTILMRTILGDRDAQTDIGTRESFWSRVAFYNFVQEFPGKGARIRPTDQMWERARHLLPEVIEKTAPHMILVTGVCLARELPPTKHPPLRCEIPHPAWPGFSYDDCISVVKNALADTRRFIA